MNNKNENDIFIPFWAEDPNIIFNQKYLFEFFPTETMTYNQKLNSISRTILFLAIASFVFTRRFSILIVSFVTLASIFFLHKYYTKEQTKRTQKENFTDETQTLIVNDVLKQNTISPPTGDVFDIPQENNPFSNVLMTDYDFNPNKKPAPPSYNENVAESILEKTKETVAVINSTQPDIADKLFKDLGDELYYEQSLRQFYSNPNTTIPNDQNSFADFCYGGMVSCKEGNLFACARNLSRYTNV